MANAASRFVWADGLRVLAIYLVIIIHLSALVVIPWENAFSLSWWSAHFFSSLSVIAVPILVLLSGSLLLTKVETVGAFYKKRFQRIIFPWIFWVSITLFFDWYIFRTPSLYDRNVVSIGAQYLRTAYWFMPALLQLYLITPLLRWGVLKFKLWQVVVGAVLLQSLLAVQYSYCMTTASCEAWGLPLGVQYLGYYLLGYVLSEYVPSTKIISRLAFMFGMGVGATFFATIALSKAQLGFNATAYHFISLPVFLSSVSGFILLKNILTNFSPLTQLVMKPKIKKFLAALSKESFSIFFVHGVILNVVLFFVPIAIFAPLNLFAPLMIPLFAGILFYSSYLVVLVLRKLPGIRYIS